MYDKLTKDDIKKMEEEIEYRKLVIRKKVLEEVKETRAQGDLSENFEYHAAKKAKNQNDSRIRYLERMIKTAIIIEDDTEDNQAGVNKKITVHFLDDDSVESYIIVTSVRGNSLEGYICLDSPIAKALQGHKEGDVVTVQLENGAGYDLEILKVEPIDKDLEIELRSF